MQKGLACRPPAVPRSGTADDATASASAPKGTTISGGDGRRPQAPPAPAVDAGSVPGASAAAETSEV